MTHILLGIGVRLHGSRACARSVLSLMMPPSSKPPEKNHAALILIGVLVPVGLFLSFLCGIRMHGRQQMKVVKYGAAPRREGSIELELEPAGRTADHLDEIVSGGRTADNDFVFTKSVLKDTDDIAPNDIVPSFPPSAPPSDIGAHENMPSPPTAPDVPAPEGIEMAASNWRRRTGGGGAYSYSTA